MGTLYMAAPLGLTDNSPLSAPGKALSPTVGSGAPVYQCQYLST